MKRLLIVLGLLGMTVSLNVRAEIEIEYEQFNEGLVVVKFDKQCGYLDKTGNLAVKPIYKYCQPFSEGLASVSLGGKCGYINNTGKFLINAKYEYCWAYSEGLASVNSKENGSDKYQLINKSGKVVYDFPEGMKPEGVFRQGVIAFKQDDKVGFIGRNGNNFEVTIQPKFESVQQDYFHEGDLATVKLNGKWGFINKQGEWVIDPQLELAGNFHEGLACAEVNGIYGYVDKDGKWVIQPKFQICSDFKNGMASGFLREGKSGLIDKSGNWIIQPQYSFAGPFDSNGRAMIEINSGKYPAPTMVGFIDKSENVVVPPKFILKMFPYEGLTGVELDGKFGFIDSKGEWAISPEKLKKSLSKFVEIAEKEDAKAQKEKARAEKAEAIRLASQSQLKSCSPPKGNRQQYEDECTNGDCVRTYSNGCQKRIQASHCFDPMQNDWVWKIDGC